MRLLDLASALSGLSILGSLAVLRHHFARLPRLPEAPPGLASQGRVCLCIPARDEAGEIGPALESWLAQDYPELAIVVVDDGSTDGTSEILAAKADPLRTPGAARLRVLRNDDLPPGWLGKNHALHLATRTPEALAADWLLFADADVQASPDLLRRAFAFLDEHPADILALLFAADAVSPVERLFVGLATPGFLILVPPHRVPEPGSFAFAGIGAFTLVRRAAYDAVDGHAGAPLEAVDDMMLARRVKRAGFTNRLALGGPMLHLRMYHGLLDLVRGLRKNTAALPGWWLLPLLIPGFLVHHAGPLLLAWAGFPWLGLALLLVTAALMGDVAQRITGRPMDALWVLWPLNGPVLVWGMAWAFLDRLRGRNTWRGRSVLLKPKT
ncbi:MAG: glycosyltransferase [Holophagaceae bacterium]|nr:glycosyltransferase [Holophagaceae bacterium]